MESSVAPYADNFRQNRYNSDMRLCTVCVILFAVTVFGGCRKQPTVPHDDTYTDTVITGENPNTPNPYAILDQMVTAYRAALSYSDQATVHIIGKLSQPDAEPMPWNCSVAFQRPNRLRLEVDKGFFVSDGENSCASVRLLPRQILYIPSPEQWTLETLFQDVHLDAAMALGLPASVLRFPPQLILLFANNPLNTFIPKGAHVEWLEQQRIGHALCDVIQVRHVDGSRILWISQENNALLRFEYLPVGLPVPEGFDSIEAIRIEMTNAQFEGNFTSETFQIPDHQDWERVTSFLSNTPGLFTVEEHRYRLKLMSDSDIYRQVDPLAILSGQPAPPKVAPRTFTLTQVWTLPLAGADTMALLPLTPPKLLIPCEGNVVAVIDLMGNLVQRITPEGLNDTIIMKIQVNTLSGNTISGKGRIGIITLDNKFYLYDETFKPIAVQNVAPKADTTETIQDFLFFSNDDDELLLLAVQQESVQPNAPASGVIRAFALQGERQGRLRWEYPFEGVPKQISSAVVEERKCVLISCTASQDSILLLHHDGTASEPAEIPFGRYVVWFCFLGSTFYTVWENMETGDLRFLGLDRRGKSQWSRLLPGGEFGVEPVYAVSEKKWLVSLPSGEILVFDTIGNMLDTFSLNMVPMGLFCMELNGETLLIVSDGDTVSAWKIQ